MKRLPYEEIYLFFLPSKRLSIVRLLDTHYTSNSISHGGMKISKKILTDDRSGVPYDCKQDRKLQYKKTTHYQPIRYPINQLITNKPTS